MTQIFQEIIVALVLLAIAGFILIKIVKNFNRKNKNTLHDCDNCVGCDLKETIMKNQQKCNNFQQNV